MRGWGVSDPRTAKGRFAKGNRAARRHGVYGFLAIGRMPKGCRTVRQNLGQLRRCLEDEVRRGSGRSDGAITVREAALIHAAISAEGQRRLAGWYLGLHAPTMKPSEFMALLTLQTRALESRQRAIAALFPADPGKADPFAGMFAAMPEDAQQGISLAPGDTPSGLDSPEAAS
jgi:hypothetical protein